MESVGSATASNGAQKRPAVLLLVENLSVPADRRVWAEAQSLHRTGYQVSVISPRGRFTDKDGFEMKDGIAIYRFPMPFEGARPWNFVLEYGWALLACFGLCLCVWRQRGFDVLHVGNPPDFFFPLGWLFKLFGKRFIFDQHDLSPETYLSKFKGAKPGLVHRILMWSERLSYATADAVIVTNESYRETVLKRGGLSADHVFIVRNSPNPKVFYPRPPDPKLLDGFDHMVAFVGVMGPQDGVDYLLRAAHYVRHELERRDIVFIIMGTGEAWDDLQKLHQELELQDFVRFTGRIPDEPMLGYLATADVGASPDPHNPLNDISTMQKTMEFMAMGKPLVSFDLRESRYSAQDAALYVPNNDTQAFGQAIVDLIDDPERRKIMGEFGRLRIQNELSWSRSEDNLRAAYQCALGTRALQFESAP